MVDATCVNAWMFEVSYGYDDDGHVVRIGYPSGRTVDYVRNVLGDATSVTTATVPGTSTLAQNIEYLPFGPMKKLTYGNGLMETRGFDQQYRIASQLITKPSRTVRRSPGHVRCGGQWRISRSRWSRVRKLR